MTLVIMIFLNRISVPLCLLECYYIYCTTWCIALTVWSNNMDNYTNFVICIDYKDENTGKKIPKLASSNIKHHPK